MKYEVVVINQDKGKTMIDTVLVGDNKKDILRLLADNLDETLSVSHVKISIREIK